MHQAGWGWPVDNRSLQLGPVTPFIRKGSVIAISLQLFRREVSVLLGLDTAFIKTENVLALWWKNNDQHVSRAQVGP